jgi:hypothetical protein
MISPDELAEAEITDENRPDVIIREFRQLLDVFPGIPLPHREKDERVEGL